MRPVDPIHHTVFVQRQQVPKIFFGDCNYEKKPVNFFKRKLFSDRIVLFIRGRVELSLKLHFCLENERLNFQAEERPTTDVKLPSWMQHGINAGSEASRNAKPGTAINMQAGLDDLGNYESRTEFSEKNKEL